MKEHEIEPMMERVARYRELEKIRNQIADALAAVLAPWSEGPCGQGPFTGNTRESRQVESMLISFSPTRGGACGVEMRIQDMHIEASELGLALQSMLRAKLAALNAEMDKV